MKIIITFCFLIFSTCSFAEIFKWVDADGKVHFGDSLPQDAAPEKIDLKVNSYTDTSIGVAVTNSDKVVIYSTSWCGYCKKAKKYFANNNIDYIEYDIEDSLSAKVSYDKLGLNGVPVILYNGKLMSGFSKSKFKQFYQN